MLVSHVSFSLKASAVTDASAAAATAGEAAAAAARMIFGRIFGFRLADHGGIEENVARFGNIQAFTFDKGICRCFFDRRIHLFHFQMRQEQRD